MNMMDIDVNDDRLVKKGSIDSGYCGDTGRDNSLNKPRLTRQTRFEECSHNNFQSSVECDEDIELTINDTFHHTNFNEITNTALDNEHAVSCSKTAVCGNMLELDHQCEENICVNSDSETDEKSMSNSHHISRRINKTRQDENNGISRESDNSSDDSDDDYIVKVKTTRQYTLQPGISRDDTDEPIFSPEGSVGVPRFEQHSSSLQDNVDNKTDIDHEHHNNITSHDMTEHHSKHADSQKMKSTTLRIDGDTKLLGIDTVKFQYRGHKYIHHYATICDTADIDGDIGIKRRDEIREVNGHKLVGEKQKTVKKIFKKIKPDPTTHQIKIRLVLRRWIKSDEENEEDVYIKVCDIELDLILIQENQERAPVFDDNLGQRTENTQQRHTKLKFSNGFRWNKIKAPRYSGKFNIVKETFTDAKPGMIDGIEMHGEKMVKIKVDEQRYMLYEDGHLHAGVLDHQSSRGVYTIEKFIGRNLVPDGISTTCLCYRISAKTPKGCVFLSSNLDDQGDTNVRLKYDVYDTISTNIDERCFIVARHGHETTLRSLIHREHFISYNKDNDNFVMKEIPKEQYKAYIKGISSDKPADRHTENYISAVDKLSDCWLDFFPYTKLDKGFISSLFTSLFVCGNSHSGRSIHNNIS